VKNPPGKTHQYGFPVTPATCFFGWKKLPLCNLLATMLMQ